MQLDGFTLLAQIINFLILVVLLKRFLYQPILAAMDRREALIAERLQQAEQREQVAATAASDYQHRQQELDGERQQLLAAARAAAEDERRSGLAAARQEIEQARQTWRAALLSEQEEFLQAVRRELSSNACRVARQVLSELADAALEEQILQLFLRRLPTLASAERQALAADGRVRLSSAFALTAAQRERVAIGIRTVLGEALEVGFEQQPRLICGVALQSSGYTLAWNTADYIAGLEGMLATAPVAVAAD